MGNLRNENLANAGSSGYKKIITYDRLFRFKLVWLSLFGYKMKFAKAF